MRGQVRTVNPVGRAIPPGMAGALLAAAVLLAGYEKDKAAAAALLGDFRAVAAAGLRGCASTPLTGDAARRALSLADAAIQRLAAQVNPKITLSVLAAKLG